ncbi:Multidrug transporter EmrE [Aliiroseovarius crassostreae]|nr:Multidrug transporter EmrE [Aliiroseovarius crassostreae]
MKRAAKGLVSPASLTQNSLRGRPKALRIFEITHALSCPDFCRSRRNHKHLSLAGQSAIPRLGPSITVVVACGISFALLAWVLKFMSVGIAYALWSGLAIVLIAVIGLVAFGQKLDLPAVIGLLLIVAGIVVTNLFSVSSPH